MGNLPSSALQAMLDAMSHVQQITIVLFLDLLSP